ncbi:hypothetical protein BsWGS_27679 [Bradybaena similaris]
MMKVYRPLCSDVTLRLAVDISPCYDDSDEDISVDGDYELSDRANTDRANQLRENNKIQSNHNKSEDNVLTNQTTKNHNSKSHNHSCSWYSRHNTPDKTAKDIYNHEHVADMSLDNIQNICLDSEFKRCVEEEGNDFKEDVCTCEMVDNRWKRYHQSIPVTDAANENCRRAFNQYFDAEQSCCFDEETRLEYETYQSHNLLAEDNGSSQLTDTPRCSGKCSANMQWPVKNISVDRNDNICHQDTQPEEALVDHTDEDKEFQTLGCTDEGSSGSHEELPIDLDEDIDIIDKMVMRQSMTASCFEENDASELVEPMVESFQAEEITSDMSKSIAEEIHDVLLGDDEEKAEIQLTTTGVNVLPFSYPFTLKHVGHLFDKSRHLFTISETKTRINLLPAEVSPQIHCSHQNVNILPSYDGPKTQTIAPIIGDTLVKKCSVSTMTAVSSLELEVTHRGLHRFIPRHKDEMNIGIGDPIHVIKECDDLWCEGINLRTGERGIFPAMYANDLNFLEESDDEDEYWKFSMRFLGSVEVASHKGDETLVQAISKVAKSQKGNVSSASLSTLEINQYGIRMIDKSKEGHEKDAFSHFFALKNISFCGTHPKDNRYFAFITKHPRDYKFACHVFHGDRPTHRARDALGEAFKRFYQEYMAFTHPTEDIYME